MREKEKTRSFKMNKLILAILLTILSGSVFAQTIPNALPLYNSYSCNSATTQFPYSFYINATSDMVLQLTDNLGNISYPSNFTVDTTNVWVNYPLVGTCPTGDTVTLYASTPITQITTYGNRTPFTATAVGSSLNKLTIIDQQLQRQLNTALLLPVGQTPGTFPSPSPGNYIGWNASSMLSNIPSPSNAAVWSLSGGNAQFNTGNVSTSGNITAIASGSYFAPNVGIGSSSPGHALDVIGTVMATNFIGSITGNVTGNVSGTSATVTTAAQPNITSVGTLTSLLVSGNVGINSISPGQLLDVQGTIRGTSFTGQSGHGLFGAWSVSGSGACGGAGSSGCVIGTIYQATTDGIVVAWNESSTIPELTGVSDANSTPSIVRAINYGNNDGFCSITFPVRKGDYFQVTEANEASEAMYFLPIGS